MLTKLKIWWLKFNLRSTYLYIAELQNNYSCGNTLSEYMSAEIRDAKHRFDAIANELALLDPLCPNVRYYPNSERGEVEG